MFSSPHRLFFLRGAAARLSSPAPLSKSRSMISSTAAASSDLVNILQKQLEDIKEAGTYKYERVITSSQSSEISVNGMDKRVLNFCANNYLGLSDNQTIINAAKETLDSHGFGLSSVRFICGTQNIHKELEKSIARFHSTEDCILFPSCFDANAGLFESILTKEDAVISDELNHASIIDGIRLCKAQRFRYKHIDMADLEAKLQEADRAGARIKLIATDGVFSMDGDIAPLDAICALADQYGATLMIDECHATGFFGRTGRGTDEHCGVHGRVDIINSTLGKALGGGTGGYTAGKKEVIDILRNKARPYLFSNALAPSMVGAALKVFEMLEQSSEAVEKVRANTHRFRDRMMDAGFELKGDRDHPIAPVMLYDARVAADFSDRMLQKGIFVIGFSYPVVPEGKARIRVQMSAAHSLEEVDQAVDAFIEIGKEMKVIP